MLGRRPCKVNIRASSRFRYYDGIAQAKDTKDYAIALLTSLPLERAVAVMGRLIKTTGTALQRKPLKGGAGGNWNVMNEIVDPTVVKQVTPTSCGAACGNDIKDRNIFHISD